MRYFCRVEYDGTAYAGWQLQENAPTVQAALEKAFSVVIRTECRITGAGRTDTGVHARRQGMHADLPDGLDMDRFQNSVNALLPADIAIYDVQAVSGSFHARYSALERRYSYYFTVRKTPLWYRRSLYVYYPVDWKRIEENILYLCGEHDFAAFCAAGHSAAHTRCIVRNASLCSDRGLMVFSITANRFLYRMVRSLVGTLLMIGSGRIATSLKELLERMDRSRVGDTAPAHGLVLEDVRYDEVA